MFKKTLPSQINGIKPLGAKPLRMCRCRANRKSLLFSLPPKSEGIVLINIKTFSGLDAVKEKACSGNCKCSKRNTSGNKPTGILLMGAEYLHDTDLGQQAEEVKAAREKQVKDGKVNPVYSHLPGPFFENQEP